MESLRCEFRGGCGRGGGYSTKQVSEILVAHLRLGFGVLRRLRQFKP